MSEITHHARRAAELLFDDLSASSTTLAAVLGVSGKHAISTLAALADRCVKPGVYLTYRAGVWTVSSAPHGDSRAAITQAASARIVMTDSLHDLLTRNVHVSIASGDLESVERYVSRGGNTSGLFDVSIFETKVSHFGRCVLDLSSAYRSGITLAPGVPIVSRAAALEFIRAHPRCESEHLVDALNLTSDITASLAQLEVRLASSGVRYDGRWHVEPDRAPAYALARLLADAVDLTRDLHRDLRTAAMTSALPKRVADDLSERRLVIPRDLARLPYATAMPVRLSEAGRIALDILDATYRHHEEIP